MRLLLPMIPAWALVAALCLAVRARAARYATFRTEPSFKSAILRINTSVDDRSLLAPGYLFITPGKDPNVQSPQIFTQAGDLVWDGRQSLHHLGLRTQCLTVCDFLGSIGDHLCWSERFDDGRNRIFSNTYEQVGEDYEMVGSLAQYDNVDSHEFKMLPGGKTFIQMMDRRVEMDLEEYGGPQKGVVIDECFQEVDVATLTELFRWCYTENLPISITDVLLDNSTKGEKSIGPGRGTRDSAWDAVHMNAVDKTSEGDYLVSCRHLDTIVKVAGNNNEQGAQPGEVLWKLGGKASDFTLDEDLRFRRQHNVRFLSRQGNVTTISVFNNDKAYPDEDSVTSSGLVMDLDTAAMEAHLSARYPRPSGRRAIAQGSFQPLPNGNWLAGWTYPTGITEWSSNGTILYDATIVQGACRSGYRGQKYEWSGYPLQPPKLLVYSQDCDFAESPLVAYVSWNGATEVASWRFSVMILESDGWKDAGTVAKKRFETKYVLHRKRLRAINGSFVRDIKMVRVEAHDANGALLASTTAVPFVPRFYKKKDCNADGCEDHYEYPAHQSRFHICSMDRLYSKFGGALALGVASIIAESIAYMAQMMLTELPGPSVLPKAGSVALS